MAVACKHCGAGGPSCGLSWPLPSFATIGLQPWGCLLPPVGCLPQQSALPVRCLGHPPCRHLGLHSADLRSSRGARGCRRAAAAAGSRPQCSHPVWRCHSAAQSGIHGPPAGGQPAAGCRRRRGAARRRRADRAVSVWAGDAAVAAGLVAWMGLACFGLLGAKAVLNRNEPPVVVPEACAATYRCCCHHSKRSRCRPHPTHAAGTRRCSRAGARWRRRFLPPARPSQTCVIDAGGWQQTWPPADRLESGIASYLRLCNAPAAKAWRSHAPELSSSRCCAAVASSSLAAEGTPAPALRCSALLDCTVVATTAPRSLPAVVPTALSLRSLLLQSRSQICSVPSMTPQAC